MDIKITRFTNGHTGEREKQVIQNMDLIHIIMNCPAHIWGVGWDDREKGFLHGLDTSFTIMVDRENHLLE